MAPRVLSNRSRPVRTGLVAALATGLAGALTAVAPAGAAPSAATAYTPSSADTRLSRMLTARATTSRVGTSFGGVVLDVQSNAVIWGRNSGTIYPPASTAKWVTATNALTVFGPSYRFTTVARRGSQADQVVLVGSGDPTLTSNQLGRLAADTAANLKARGQKRIRLYADDTLFPAPTRATGWRTGAIPYDTTWLRALVADGSQSSDTTMDAAKKFKAKLSAQGITVASVTRGRASTANPVLASFKGYSVSTIVAWMMTRSDNEYAEALHRLVSIRTGYGNTWSAARSAQTAALSKQGLSVFAFYDGSGLSHSDRATPSQLARMVNNAFEPANSTSLAVLRSDVGLPISGRTGTLSTSYQRFVTAAAKCAVGKVHAKTGTLSDVSSLSGYTMGTDGRLKSFAFVINRKTSTTAVRQTLDMLAATVTGCY